MADFSGLALNVSNPFGTSGTGIAAGTSLNNTASIPSNLGISSAPTHILPNPLSSFSFSGQSTPAAAAPAGNPDQSVIHAITSGQAPAAAASANTALPAPYSYTPSGGMSFNATPQAAAAAVKPAASNPSTSYTGSNVSYDTTGTPTGYSPGYSINTGSTVPSEALGGGVASSDLSTQRNQYADYVNSLAQASGYSPDYLAAYQQSQTLGAQAAQLQGNLATGNVPGDTQDFAEGFTNRALMGADAQKAFADIALQTQTLLRQGNIAGAQALVSAYAPTSVSPGASLVSPVTGAETYSGLGGYQAVQGIQTVNNLANTYPDANIAPTDSLEVAQQKAQNSPSFIAKNQYMQQLAGGETVVYNKLTGQYQTIQGAGQATTISAAADNVKTLTAQQTQLQTSLSTADKDFSSITQLMQKAGINDSQTPIINQLNNRLQAGTLGNGDVAAYQSAISELQNMYAGVLAAKNGGPVDDSVRAQAAQIIPPNLNLANLNKVITQIKTMGTNALGSVNDSINSNLSTINSGGAAPSSTNGSVGNSWANL